ncbi:DUF4276 family protein [Sphaerotilus sp.]|uniref:DUF4276 family protein n=1 Tax=Sphaerotilus sp. TaxID=2093942 RepID=UPI002ACEEF14|nr:DUF4276 family protein [Sphaerotilus sp.]MDZ7859042.1 DUF4276 family protein [Sphaerotilus sp.]
MRYLGLALYAEGRTDYYFLQPLLERLCMDLCLREASGPVEVTAVLGLDHPPAIEQAPRDVRIREAARSALGQWSLLFVHADGAGDPVRARAQQIDPALGALHTAFGTAGCGVAVVPVRETEAWTLVDGDALRQVFGTTLDDDALGLPQPAHCAETVTDPKKCLDLAFAATSPTGARRRRGVSDYLGALGEEIRLDRLRLLDSFLALEDELRRALRGLNLLR